MTAQPSLFDDDPGWQRPRLERFDLGHLMEEHQRPGPRLPLDWTEAQLLSRAIHASNDLRLLHFHDYSGTVSLTGFPDLVIAGPRGLVIWELKAANGTLTPAQEAWGRVLKAAGRASGVPLYSVATPADWQSGELMRRLRAIAEEDEAEAA